MLGAVLKVGGAAIKSAVNRARKKRAEKKTARAERKIKEAESVLAGKITKGEIAKVSSSGSGDVADSAVESKFVVLGQTKKKINKLILIAVTSVVVFVSLLFVLFRKKRR